MNMNFEQTNRLLLLIEDSKDAIQPCHFDTAYRLKIGNSGLYNRLIEIAASNDSGIDNIECFVLDVD